MPASRHKDNMTLPTQENQAEQKPTDKELNFRQLERKLEQERQARIQAEERAAAVERAAQEKTKYVHSDEEDNDDEPYVDKKRLKKVLNQFGEQTKAQTAQDIQQAVQAALEQERKASYLRDNSDFNNVMASDTVQKFADMHPRVAEIILRMPEGFERQKLVYENIKAMGLDKPAAKQPSIQDKIDQNRRSPFYQPTAPGAPPFSPQGDFSAAGQKNAHDQMKALQARLTGRR